ncbi:cupin domain-containing protein [Sulfurospirillum sp. 1307]
MNLLDVKIPDFGESFEALYEKDEVLIERIVSSDLLEDKSYVQDYDEFVVLIKGEAKLLVDKDEVILKELDTLLIPKGVYHKVLETKKGSVWLCIHLKK